MPQSLALVHQHLPRNVLRYCGMITFYEDAAGPETEFPAYCFIEPDYFWPGANDDHPPTDIMAGQQLIADVYNALRANEELWSSSLLMVLYDEHGGLYDHYSPPSAIPPDHHKEEFAFDQLGVRVPAVLVSPYVKAGCLSTVLDHTSVLKYLIEKWALRPLGARATAANSFASALMDQPRTDTPENIPGPALTPALTMAVRPLHLTAPTAVRPLQLTANQSSLLALTHLLESLTDASPMK